MTVDLPDEDAIIADLAAHPELYRDDQIQVATEVAGYARDRLSRTESRTTEDYRRRRAPADIVITEGRVNVYVEMVHPNAWAIEFVNRGGGRVGPMRYALDVLRRS